MTPLSLRSIASNMSYISQVTTWALVNHRLLCGGRYSKKQRTYDISETSQCPNRRHRRCYRRQRQEVRGRSQQELARTPNGMAQVEIWPFLTLLPIVVTELVILFAQAL